MTIKIIDERFVDPKLQDIITETNQVLHDRKTFNNQMLLSAITKLSEGLVTVESYEGQAEYLGKYFPYFQILTNYRKLIQNELNSRPEVR
jgi:hypothetical protein